MYSHSLAGDWQFRKRDSKEDNDFGTWMPAVVPGGVHTDLLNLNKIPDPFVADHELDVMWVAEANWEYRKTFDITQDQMGEDQIYLICYGLDTLATVFINGTLIGKSENMFWQNKWKIKQLLNIGSNTISVIFDSPVRYISDLNNQSPMLGVSQAIPGGPYLRKAPCQFGWDWGPMLPPIGIWKDIRLEGYSQGRIKEVHLRQIHENGEITIWAGLEIEKWIENPLDVSLDVISPNGKKEKLDLVVSDSNKNEFSYKVSNPELWWPNGYGNQNLYNVSISLSQNSFVLDQRDFRIGLRKIEVQQNPDEWGESFTFIVNDVPVFAKGSNWIPADTFPTRNTRESLEGLIRSAAISHQNMLRVWGGGFYEDEIFYDLCDEYGILVWQDMIFSCSIYPLDDQKFVENIKTEVIQNVSRLRHRTSLAIWCGNNEMEWGWESWGWKTNASDYIGSYDQFFHTTLPAWINQLDPDRMYWPSSPSSNTPFTNVNGQMKGDAHYWDVWHGRKPFTAYRDQFPRFMSEFGFQSLPPMKTIASYADEADWNMTSYIMEHHQRSGNGNGLMIGQMTDTFRMPNNFSSLVYLSMVLQAEGIRYGVEHWRRNKHRVSGTLYWQLNDCWPVASWSSLDYYGRWKALHYATKRFYEPLLLSIVEQGLRMDVHITSDCIDDWEGSVDWMLISLDGKVLAEGSESDFIKGLESKQVLSRSFQLDQKQCRNTIFVCSIRNPNGIQSYRMATFVPNKHLNLRDPEIQFEIEEETDKLVLNVSSKYLARFVEISIEGFDVVFSDNYIDLPGGKTVSIYCIKPDGLTVNEVKDKVKFFSLIDSYK